MGRRNVIYCDWCKQEFDDDASFGELVFKKPGKRKGNSYELCSGCLLKVQERLISDEPIKSPIKRPEKPPKGPPQRKSRVETIDIEQTPGDCRHINRTPPKPVSSQDDTDWVQVCKDCGDTIKARKKTALAAPKSGDDIAITDFNQ
jgi:hypothetical protein